MITLIVFAANAALPSSLAESGTPTQVSAAHYSARFSSQDLQIDTVMSDEVDRLIKPGTLELINRMATTETYRFARTAGDPTDKAEVKYSRVTTLDVTVALSVDDHTVLEIFDLSVDSGASR